MKKVEYLCLSNGDEPARKWLLELDVIKRTKIRAYIDRVAAGGGKKNVRSLGDSIFEIKIDFGSGYRIYFSEVKQMILLLCGGNKSTQKKDIEKAKMFWRKYVSK